MAQSDNPADPSDPWDNGQDPTTQINPGVTDPNSISVVPPTFDSSAALQQLPLLDQPEFSQVVSGYNLNFAGPSTSTTQNFDGSPRQNVVKYAESFVGTPYRWGGSSPGGFDCSGLVQYVTNAFGMKLPRLSYAQAGAGSVVPMAQLQPGDLVVMNGGEHIAIYAGNGQIVEAPHTGSSVRVRALGKGEQYYGVHLNYPGEKASTSYSNGFSPGMPPPTAKPVYGRLTGNAAATAQSIIQVGRQMGASNRDIQIALMTAWTESSFETTAVGDGGEALGPFQQHASWGSYGSRTSAAGSARAFYRALFGVQNRNAMSPWQAAQAVQRSAYSDGSNYQANWGQGQLFYNQYAGR